jgi:hypothetical protein
LDVPRELRPCVLGHDRLQLEARLLVHEHSRLLEDDLIPAGFVGPVPEHRDAGDGHCGCD